MAREISCHGRARPPKRRSISGALILPLMSDRHDADMMPEAARLSDECCAAETV